MISPRTTQIIWLPRAEPRSGGQAKALEGHKTPSPDNSSSEKSPADFATKKRGPANLVAAMLRHKSERPVRNWTGCAGGWYLFDMACDARFLSRMWLFVCFSVVPQRSCTDLLNAIDLLGRILKDVLESAVLRSRELATYIRSSSRPVLGSFTWSSGVLECCCLPS